ncbi:fumarylacetoacetase [Altererythrobacter salegens]|uniref:fumarylacetoacetase n=1 Tax=Croceibacterium salegens TaxID=1737568 RepID=A0A6I4SR10_9SPHN|nr:fumarylacetoacetase [Croceibacterium salegens]MXO58274.1 fumarylacetoacetase [Croceibacterium salegens]
MTALDETHDPTASSWVDGADDHSEFPVQNLPLGIFSTGDGTRRGGVAIGDFVCDLGAVAPLLSGPAAEAATLASGATLNALFSRGNFAADALRTSLFGLFTDISSKAEVSRFLHRMTDCTLHLPFAIGDYTDFYTGIHHAENVGKQFRPDNPLLPNYKWVPIGYHGRASSIVPSGCDVIRPQGQQKNPDGDAPLFGPSKRLDYEMEMAVWTSGSNAMGQPIPIGEAGDHIAGLSILNDWSARDLQAWEYQPLGPFLAKNFNSTISPWVVTSAALAPFRIAQPARPEGDPAPLPYLSDAADQDHGAYAIEMEVLLSTAKMRAAGIEPHRLSKGPMSAMYWTAAQLIAHHTVNGCNLQPGDLLGTGTLSNETPDTFGSLLELSEGGKKAIELPGGETRTFLQDGDEIVMRAHAVREGRRTIGFGECRGRIVG